MELAVMLHLRCSDPKGHDNRKSNIELLCPNCHALTNTYRGKNVILKYGKIKNKLKEKQKEF
jgi:predicted HNH restriction endonuclease